MKQIEILKTDLPGKSSFKYFDFPKYKIEFLVYLSSDSNILVYSSFCPHYGGKLSISNNTLLCHFHDYKFNLNSGVCINKKNGLKCTSFYFLETDNSIIIPLE